jgi:hypothetical protein
MMHALLMLPTDRKSTRSNPNGASLARAEQLLDASSLEQPSPQSKSNSISV